MPKGSERPGLLDDLGEREIAAALAQVVVPGVGVTVQSVGTGERQVSLEGPGETWRINVDRPPEGPSTLADLLGIVRRRAPAGFLVDVATPSGVPAETPPEPEAEVS